MHAQLKTFYTVINNSGHENFYLEAGALSINLAPHSPKEKKPSIITLVIERSRRNGRLSILEERFGQKNHCPTKFMQGAVEKTHKQKMLTVNAKLAFITGRGKSR